ncbi:hypothetical protein D3M96_08020 [Alcaligenes aquatilis]|uniref:Uncharacterized protein n=1 Tax=Alcaligenes aquatilis TaxID=323284 RepID=A0A3G2HTK2_9BURK|nr:hypothetical protein D3M96_08020 [Alcaligenes aquatilis]
MTARTPWYGEGNSKPPIPPPATHLFLASAQHAQARQGRRRQGSKPDGRDSVRGAGCSPRTRRQNAGTHGDCRRMSLLSTVSHDTIYIMQRWNIGYAHR